MFRSKRIERGPEALATDLAFAIKAYRRAYLRSALSDTTEFAEKEVERTFKALESRIGTEQAGAVMLGIEATLNI